MFSFAWAIFVLQVCTVIVYQQTDRLVLGIFLGAAAVALYEAAGKFQGLVSQITTFAVSAVMPVASQFDAQGRRDSIRSLFLRGTKYAIALICPIVVVLMVVAHPLLQAWLGSRFANYAFAAQVLISHQLLTSGVAVGDSMLGGLGLVRRRVPYAVGVAALNLSLSLLLVRPLGILGVVLGTAIPYFVDYPFHMAILLRASEVPFREWLRRTVAPTYPLLLLPLSVSLALSATPLRDSIPGIAAIGALSVGPYWLAVYLFGFEPHEREDVRSGVRAAWARATGRA
jgi:O-antigen/teichoic acid export membrane protein